MTGATYRLPDEPAPGRLERYATNPMWPLLAVMLGGNALGLAWFVFNGAALGSPTRAREWLAVGASLLGSVALATAIGAATHAGALQAHHVPYALLSVTLLHLAMAYALYLMQARCHELWEHYGGVSRNGAPVLILMAVFGRNLLQADQWHPVLRVALQ